MASRDDLLSDGEFEGITDAVLRGLGDSLAEHIEQQMLAAVVQALTWAVRAKLEFALLVLVLSGDLDILIDEDGKMRFVGGPLKVAGTVPRFSAN